MVRRNVYIAEKDKAVQELLAAGLKSRGFNIVLFDTGYPIVAMMDNWPDIFLIDIQLPGINGLEVCKWLKSHEMSRNIPVILLSDDRYLKTLAASAPADDYVEKPFYPKDIAGRINDCLYAEKVHH